MRESAISVLTLTSYQAVIIVAEIVATVTPVAHTKERAMNREYLEAKFDLCINEAEKDLQQEEIARAIANLKRANSALSQLFGFEEEEE
jgi:hypothetical protein